MMNYIWAVIMLISIVFGIATGNSAAVTDAIFDGAEGTVELALFLLGTMAFFSGIMRIADKCGITAFLARILSPLLSFLFPGIDTSGPAARSVTMNVSANMLGLGNAATPAGLEAMRHFNEDNGRRRTASVHMIMFVVLNTSSVQLIPTTIAALRAKHGASAPLDIMPAVWLTSICSLAVGILLVKIFSAPSNIKFGKPSSR